MHSHMMQNKAFTFIPLWHNSIQSQESASCKRIVKFGRNYDIDCV